MAKGNNTKIENLETSWNGYTGERVEEFIKQEISNLQTSKVGYIFENPETEKVDFYASEIDYNEGKSPIGSMASKPPYTLYVKEDSSNKTTFLAGDANKKFVWYFKTLNNDEEKTLFPESVIVDYKFKNIDKDTEKVISTEISNNSDSSNENFTKVEIDLNQYLTNGKTQVTIAIRGSRTKRSALISRDINIILLEMTDTSEFSTPALTSMILKADVLCTLGQTYHLQYRFDNGDYVFDSAYDKAGSQMVDAITYQLPISNLEDGKHVVEYRLFVTIDGQSQPYFTQTNRIEFIKGENVRFDEPQILLYSTYYENEDIEATDNNLIYNNVYQYIPFSIRYAVYNSSENTTVLEFIDETENVENIAPVASSIKNGEHKDVIIQFMDFELKTIRIITKDIDGNQTNEGRIIYLDVKKSTLNINICDRDLRIDFNSISKTNDTQEDVWTSIVNNNNIEKVYNAYFNEGFNWSNGWTENGLVVTDGSEVSFDYCPFPKQESNANAETKVEYVGGSNGYTFEIEFMTQNVTNENSVVCNMIDESYGGVCGLLITGTEIKFTTPNNYKVSSRFKEGEINRATIVVRPFYDSDGTFKGLIELYMNGVVCSVTNYTENEAFMVTELNEENKYVSKRLKFSAKKGADIVIKHIRAYNSALSSDEIVNNYILFKQDSSEMLRLYEDNNVLEGGSVTYQSVIAKGDIPVLIFVGRTNKDELATGDGNVDGDEPYKEGEIGANDRNWYETLEKTSNKNETIDMDVIYYNPLDLSKNFKFVKAYIRPQGTSSMLYPKKNYRIYTQKNKDTRCFFPILDKDGKIEKPLDLIDMLKPNFGENESDRVWEKWRGTKNYKKKKYSFKDGAQPVKCWCLKADFAETSSSHNTGVARLWGETLKEASVKLGESEEYVFRTNAQTAAIQYNYKYDVRTTIDGFPIVVFGAKSYSGPFKFLGKYNFNNDKSTESVFGFCDIDNDSAHTLTDTYIDYDTNNTYESAHTLDWQLDKFMSCIETLDNGNALANFSTLEKFSDVVGIDEDYNVDIKGWEDAFEFRYPEKPEPPNPADYKDSEGNWVEREQYEKDRKEYLTVTLFEWENAHVKPLKHFAEWLYSTRWCDVDGKILTGELQIIADAGTEVDENGRVLTTVEEIAKYRQSKFSKEKWDHLDVWKMAAYYIYAMRFGAVDQIVKNTMLTSEGPFACDEDGNKYGLLDITDNTSENYGRYFKWYYINYDNDTIMGVKNDGTLAFGPNILRNKKESDGNYSYAGWDSTLWNNFDTDDNFQKIVKIVDKGISNYLTYDRAINMFDEQQVGKWCERIYNHDADYKYLTPYTGGWVYEGDNEDGQVPFSMQLPKLQGSRTAHRRWWLSRRFNLFDGKWNSGEYANKYVEVKSTYNAIGAEFNAVAGANAYFGYQINGQTFNQGKPDGGTSFEYTSGEKINWKLYKVINIGDPIKIYGSADMMELNLQGLSQNLTELNFIFGNNNDNPNKLEVLNISVPEETLIGEYYYTAHKTYEDLQKIYSDFPTFIHEEYWVNYTFETEITATKDSVQFYRLKIYDEDGEKYEFTYFSKMYGGIRNNTFNNMGFLGNLNKLQDFRMAGYANVKNLALTSNSFIHTLDTRYSGVENIDFSESSRISNLKVSNSLKNLVFHRCNSITLNNIMVDNKTLEENKGINIKEIHSLESKGLNYDNKFKDFILNWVKDGASEIPVNSKTLELTDVKWKGITVKDIETLARFANEAFDCIISGEFSMGSANISRNDKKIIENFQNKEGIDVRIRYPYPSVLINEVNDIIAGDDITITSTIFADSFSENENFNIEYIFVREVEASTNSNILHDFNTGRYYEPLSISNIRNGSLKLIQDKEDKKKVVLRTDEVVCKEDTKVLLASKFIYGGEIKFDVVSFVIKDPTYANKGEIIGESSITSFSDNSATYTYKLKLYTDKGKTPIGTILKNWSIYGDGLEYINGERYADEEGLQYTITTNNATPEKAAKITIRVEVDNLNEDYEDLIIEKEILILNENIIMTSQSNSVVMGICYENGFAENEDAMSIQEALNVTDIKNYFSNIQSEFGFDEFKYFTNVQSLSDNAFKNSKIKTITLHNNVATFGNSVFEGCTKLISVKLPNTLEVITEKMFLNCSSLEMLELPDTVRTIKPYAFGGTKMEKILFKGTASKTSKVIYLSENISLQTIENNAFETNSAWTASKITNVLDEVSVPNDLIITDKAYNFLISNKLSKINLTTECDCYLENNILYTDESKNAIVRALCNLSTNDIAEEIVIETNRVFEYAFLSSNIAKKLTITVIAGAGLGKGAFYGSKFTELDLRESQLKLIYDDTFLNMVNAEKILLPQKGTLAKMGTNMFSSSMNLKELIIPESVIQITSGQSLYFINNCGIRTLTLPDNIVSAPRNLVKNCQYLEEFNYSPYCIMDNIEQVVDDCVSLKKIKLPLFSTTVGSNRYFVLNNNTIIAGPYFSPTDAQIQINNLRVLEENANILDVNKGNFSIKEYITGENVIINEQFFINGESNTFNNCPNIEFFSLNENDNKEMVFVSNNGVDGCTEHESDLAEGKTVIRIFGNGDKYLLKLANAYDNYTTPGDIVGYGNGAFAWTKITTVDENMLANNLYEIPNGLFAHTKSLQTVTLPESIEVIWDFAFYESGVKNVYLPQNLLEIKQGVFTLCKALDSIIIPESVNAMGLNNNGDVNTGVFEKCSSLKHITLPINVREISKRMFFDCEKLETIEALSPNLDKISRFSFCGCKKLKDIKICSRSLPVMDTGDIENGLYKYHPFGYGTSTFVGTNVTGEKCLYVSYNTTEQYTSEPKWKTPLLSTHCKFTIKELPINDTVVLTHSSLEDYDVIYPISQSEGFTIPYGVYKTEGTNNFELVFTEDAYDGEIIYIYSDSAHTKLICQFTLSYKKNVYNETDYLLGNTRKRVLFGTSLFTNKQTETENVNDEVVSITKSEYNLLLSKIDKLTRLVNLKK